MTLIRYGVKTAFEHGARRGWMSFYPTRRIGYHLRDQYAPCTILEDIGRHESSDVKRIAAK